MELLNTLVDYLKKLMEGMDRVSTLIDAGRFQEAMNLSADLSEGLNWIAQALVQGEVMNQDGLSEYNNILQEMLEAMRSKDYIMYADIMRYELKELIDDYYEKVLVITGDDVNEHTS